MNAPAYAQTIQAVSTAPEPSEAPDRGSDVQRSALGANEAQDLQPARDIERSHKRDGAAIERLQKKLSASIPTGSGK